MKLGLEFSGVDRISGRRICGVSNQGCMATKLFTPEQLLWEIPEHISTQAACTLPVVYATVYYALVCKANIQPGQVVLIHSIAGGVGQAAYHVCTHRGCTNWDMLSRKETVGTRTPWVTIRSYI